MKLDSIKHFLIITFILLKLDVVGQKCGIGQHDDHIIRDSSAIKQFEEQWQIRQGLKHKNTDTSKIIIPVVYHIIHENGLENVDNSTVYQALRYMNAEFANDNSAVLSQRFKHLTKNANIEFRLANKDPDGNTTSGITRTESSLTAVGDYQIFNLIHWPHKYYLNIYIVRHANGNAGYAYFPGAGGNYDGFVLQYNYLKYAGTHEAGHWLNLEHTWGPSDFSSFSKCNEDDGVDDTPNCSGTDGCDTNKYSCNSYDNVENFMDYGCGKMFTAGQVDRMRYTLDWTRRFLHPDSNLVKTGTDSLYALQDVNTSHNANLRCYIYDEITFNAEVSPYRYEDSIVWSFENGTLLKSNDDKVTLRFSKLGWQFYQLKVYKEGQLISVKSDSIFVDMPQISTTLKGKCNGDLTINTYSFFNHFYKSVTRDVKIVRGTLDTLHYFNTSSYIYNIPIYQTGIYPIEYHLNIDSMFNYIVYDTIEYFGVNHDKNFEITFDEFGLYEFGGNVSRTEPQTAGTYLLEEEGKGYAGSKGFTVNRSLSGTDTVIFTFPEIDLQAFETVYLSFDYAFGEKNNPSTERKLDVNLFPSCNNNTKTNILSLKNDLLDTHSDRYPNDTNDWRRVSISIDSLDHKGLSTLEFYLTIDGTTYFSLDNISITGDFNQDSVKAQFSLLSDSFQLCLGDEILLKNESINDSYYPEWIIPDSEQNRLFTESIIFQPKETGTYDVSLIVKNNINVDTLTKSFFVEILNHDTSYIYSSKDNYCHNETAKLSLIGRTDSVRWVLENSTSDNNSDVYYTHPSSGNSATYKAYFHLNSCLDSISKTVALHNNVEGLGIYLSKDTTYHGYQNDSFQLGVSARNADSFIWDMGNNQKIIKELFYYTYNEPGEYLISLIGKTKYCADTVYKSHVAKEGFRVKIQELSAAQGISLNPNPFNESIRLNTDANSIGLKFYISDAQGRIVIEQLITSSKQIIKTNNLSPGFYHFNLVNSDNARVYHSKIIKN